MSDDLVKRLRGSAWSEIDDSVMIEAATRIATLEADLARANTRALELRDRNEELEMAVDRVATLERELAEMRSRKDDAYSERNRVVAGLSRLYPSGLKRTDIPCWDPEWHGCVYIDFPSGQVSWHFHDTQEVLFEGLPEYTKQWDGHDTDEKYRRVAQLAAIRTPPGDLVEVAARAWFVAYETSPLDDPIEGPATLGRWWDERVKSTGEREIEDVADANRCMRAVLAAVTPAIVAGERERCAKVCEAQLEYDGSGLPAIQALRYSHQFASNRARKACAAAIRATEPGT